ncbi:hypothetical protein ACFXI0_29585 [Kitasatospora indigofera]|uniref:hypothetical protein n=1 Tax=Kitasatospora indigofera TaxID=67307 RepID=UPI0036C87D31
MSSTCGIASCLECSSGPLTSATTNAPEGANCARTLRCPQVIVNPCPSQSAAQPYAWAVTVRYCAS